MAPEISVYSTIWHEVPDVEVSLKAFNRMLKALLNYFRYVYYNRALDGSLILQRLSDTEI